MKLRILHLIWVVAALAMFVLVAGAPHGMGG